MYDRAMAQSRIDDLVRVAERERLARRTRRFRAAEGNGALRRIGAGLIHALTLPGRH
jgi:hypothetical protein